MKAEDAIKLINEGKTLVNYRDGVKIKKDDDSYIITSSYADLVIVVKTVEAEKNSIWGDDNYAIRLTTSSMIVLPEEEE